MTSPIDLRGRVAIVTGAGGGLGRAHALLLASRGAQVIVNDLGDAADAVVAEITAAGGKARTGKCSVADAEAVQAMVDAVLAEFGRIDILVNNAGILRDKSFAKMDLADFRLVLDVHVMGSANCTRAGLGGVAAMRVMASCTIMPFSLINISLVSVREMTGVMMM